MWYEKITAHKEYLQALDAIWKSTFGKANYAIATVLTVDQLDIPIQKLSDEEKHQVAYIGNIFMWDAKQSYETLENILWEMYENNTGNMNLQTAIQAYEKLALNQRIGIKNTIMKFNGDSWIQRTLINASNSLEQIHEFISRIERIIWKNVKEIHWDSEAIQWAEGSKQELPHPYPWGSIITNN